MGGSLCIVYPLDYSRTRLASDVGSGKKTFSGLFDCMGKTMKGPGGFGALYTGLGVSVVGIVGYRGLQLGTFDTITGLNPYKKDKGILGAVSTFAAAQTAITIGAGATYPFDTIRRRLQMQSEKPVEEHLYKGTMDCFKKIAAEEGLASGLYKGFVANIVRSVRCSQRESATWSQHFPWPLVLCLLVRVCAGQSVSCKYLFIQSQKASRCRRGAAQASDVPVVGETSTTSCWFPGGVLQ